MREWTGTELKEKVVNDLDLSNETSIADAEYLGYMNEAIDEAEAEIHRLGVEDEYFLEHAMLSLVSGTSAYAMPANIYANKIRGIVYANGSDIYQVKRIRGRNKFLYVAELDYENSATAAYRYFVNNVTGTGRRINLVPAARETSALVMKVWFIRNAARISALSDTLDIPEFANFVLSHMKCRLLMKEGDPRVQLELVNLQNQRKLMIDTLTEMVPDEDSGEIDSDFSHYEEMN